MSNMRNVWGENGVFLTGMFDKPWASIIIIRANLELKEFYYTVALLHRYISQIRISRPRTFVEFFLHEHTVGLSSSENGATSTGTKRAKVAVDMFYSVKQSTGENKM